MPIMGFKLSVATTMSRLIAFCLCFMMAATASWAHETRPAIADLSVTEDTAVLRLTMALEAPLSGVNLDGLENTDDAAESEVYDQLRALNHDDLAERLRLAWGSFSSLIRLETGGEAVSLTLTATDIPFPSSEELPRDSVVTITAQLPRGTDPVVFSWDRSLGDVILRHETSAPNAYAALLTSGEASQPIPRSGETPRESTKDTIVNYVVQGFEHILPKGLDHILFVLGLFFLSAKMRPLLIQVSAFTVAHTVTLALASYGLVTIPASIVEPLIALSITIVAFENIVVGRVTPWRTVIVFAFGLLHGLGFASVLGVLGLSQTQAALSLISFNVGVEIGQLTVIAIAYILLARPFGKKSWYRTGIEIPASLIIGLIGLYWFLERIWPVPA